MGWSRDCPVAGPHICVMEQRPLGWTPLLYLLPLVVVDVGVIIVASKKSSCVLWEWISCFSFSSSLFETASPCREALLQSFAAQHRPCWGREPHTQFKGLFAGEAMILFYFIFFILQTFPFKKMKDNTNIEIISFASFNYLHLAFIGLKFHHLFVFYFHSPPFSLKIKKLHDKISNLRD